MSNAAKGIFAPAFANPAAPKAAPAPQEKWAKSGFINIDLPDPSTESGFAKFGSIGLEVNNARHQKLLPWLMEDDGAHFQERIQIVFANARITYRSAEKDTSGGFVLPGM